MLRPTLRLRMMFLFCLVLGVFLAGTYGIGLKIFEREVRTELDNKLIDLGTLLASQFNDGSGHNGIVRMRPGVQYVELIDGNGSVVEHSLGSLGADLNIGHPPTTPHPALRTVSTATGTMRAAMVPIKEGREWIIIAESTSPLDQLDSRLRERAFGLWTVSLLLTTMIAAWYVGRSLAPIVELNQHAAMLTERATKASRHGLTARLPVPNPNDELGRLAINFNQLLSTIDAVVMQLRQFVSDAAHELRTPLSVLRGETQFLLSHERSVQEYQNRLQTVDMELGVMAEIVDGLFTLSMADAGQLPIHEEQFHLDEVLEEACGIIAPTARRKHIRIERMRWDETEFRGDQTLLRQVFLILLENAIKYSPPKARIHVGMMFVNNHSEVVVKDEGIGIPPEHLPHIFKRFYRAAPQPSDGPRSGGLGLAIVDAIMHAHGGSVRCLSEVGKGSTLVLSFPKVEPSPDCGA